MSAECVRRSQLSRRFRLLTTDVLALV